MTITDQGLTMMPVAYTHQEAQRLIAATLAEMGKRYGGDGDSTPVEPAEFQTPHGVFLLALRGGIAVGCGGWRTRGDDAEVKRMYTVPGARGTGVARAVLAALEKTARAAGKRRMILETGTRQPEAIALYESYGYRRIPNFGYYKDNPGAVSYGRNL